MQKTIYSKSSIERKNEYKIITRIYEEDGVRKVEKSAQNENAAYHVERMARIAKTNPYTTERVMLAPCEKIALGKVVLPYITGNRLDQQIDEHAKKHEWNAIYEDIKLLNNIIMNVEHKYPFQTCGEFEDMFGAHPQLDGYESASNVNVDMVASNIILADQIYIIDYEWDFEFLIPLKYIVYRSILLNGTINTLPDDVKGKVMELLEISKEEELIFFQMEVAFQHYITGVSLIDLYSGMSIKNYRINTDDLLNTLYTAKIVTEQNKKLIEKTFWLHEKANLKLDVKEYLGHKIRIELVDKPAIIKDLEVFTVKDNVCFKVEFTTNSDLYLYEQHYYQTVPVVEVVPQDCEFVQISYKVQKLEQNANEYIGTFIKHVHEESELQLIKNSRAWKAVTFAKKLFGKK